MQKNTIKDMIDDKWDEYTIEDTTILNIDLEASPMSMTSAKNPSPRSIQMILRTEEIKDKQDSDDVKVDEDFQPDGNFFPPRRECFQIYLENYYFCF